MSNALAIAAVTTTLRDLLFHRLAGDIPGVSVTTRPPDRARNGVNGNQLNLFLYYTELNGAWRNRDIPWRAKPGENRHPALPLNLHYLITAYYGENENDVDSDADPTRLLGSHRLLGQAMSILHDYPVLHAEEINSVLPSADQEEYPFDQVENIRITPQPLSLEEISKIWTGFQTQYRLSAAYEASVVLIESQRPHVSPLPVLRRGAEDRGAETIIGPFPTLEAVRRPPQERYGFQLGDTIELVGQNLGGEIVTARFSHPLRAEEDPLPLITTGSNTKLLVQLPRHDNGTGTAVTDWTAGFYAVDILIQNSGDPDRTSNRAPMALAPIIETPNTATRDGAGSVTLDITCFPDVLPQQHARLLLGNREIPAEDHPASTNTLTFVIANAPTGEFVVRLRLDGVDSLPLIRDANGVLTFDPQQKVTIS